MEIRIALLEAQLRSVDRPSAALPASTLSSQENLGTPPQEAGGDSRAGASVASETPEDPIERQRERDVSQGQQQRKEEEEEVEKEEEEEVEEEEEAAPSPSPGAPQVSIAAGLGNASTLSGIQKIDTDNTWRWFVGMGEFVQIQDHPAYSRFFRMVRVGVPHQVRPPIISA